MDEKMSNEIAFVQFPQKFDNTTRNDVYGSSLRVINEVRISYLKYSFGFSFCFSPLGKIFVS